MTIFCRLRRLVLLTAVCLSPAVAGIAQDAAPADAAAVIADLRTQRAANLEQAGAVQAKLDALPGLQLPVQQQLKELGDRIKKSQAAKEEAMKTLEAATAAVATATEAKAKADSADPPVEADMKAAAEDLAKKEAELAALKQTISDSDAAIQTAEQESVAAQKKLEELTAQGTSLTEQLSQLATARTEIETKLQEQLVATGQFVSFSADLAPVFAQRCLACHNARTARGRFNMETYTQVMRGGESGPAVDPGDGEFSNLHVVVEDGSMPQDADPLAPTEIALIKKWIDIGAPLDVGTDPNAPLISIMPKPEHPLPPETYPAPVPVTALAFSADGTQLASSGYHEVLLWNVADGTLVKRLQNVAERVYDLDFSPNGEQLAVAAGTPGELGEMKVFNVADGTLVRDYVTTEDAIFAVRFNSDGTKLLTGGADRSIRAFAVETGEEVLHLEDHADWVMDIAWSPDDSKIVSASRDKTAKVFDANTGDSLATFNGHGNTVYGVGFNADGTLAVTSGADKQVRIWKIADSKEARKIGGFGNEIFQIEVLPDGRIISPSADKTAQVHQLADGKLVHKLSGHADWVYAAAADAEMKRAATGSHDGEIRVWSLEDGKEIFKFNARP